MTLSQKIERLLIVLGALFLSCFLAARLYNVGGALFGRMLFETVHSAGPDDANDDTQDAEASTGAVDFRLWSEKRVRAFEESLAKHFTPPLALLNIPRV